MQVTVDDDYSNLSEESRIALLKQRCDGLEALLRSKEEVSFAANLMCHVFRQVH